MRRFAALAGVLLCAAVLRAADRPAFNVDTSTMGQYIWRGMLITDGPELQTSGTATYRGFHMNVFGSMDLNSVNRLRGKVSELDYDAGYDRTFEKATVSGGVIHYTYPNTEWNSTTEVYAGVALALPLQPSVKAYVDVGAIRGTYVTFDVVYGKTLAKLRAGVKWAAELSAGVGGASSGYNRGYFHVEQAGLVDFHPCLALPLSIGSRLKLTPRVGYASALQESTVARAHNFYTGLALSFVF